MEEVSLRVAIDKKNTHSALQSLSGVEDRRESEVWARQVLQSLIETHRLVECDVNTGSLTTQGHRGIVPRPSRSYGLNLVYTVIR